MISTISPTGCCASFRAMAPSFRQATSRPMRSIVARAMGAAELLDYPRENVRGLVLEEGAVTSHVVIVARAMGIPVVGQAAGAVALAENRDADHHRWRRCQGASAAVGRPAARLRGKGTLPRTPAGTVPRAQGCRAADQGRQAHHLADECRPFGRPAASERSGCRGHRPFPHRAAVHDRLDHAEGGRAGSLLSQRSEADRRQAGDLPHARYRRRQGGSLFPRGGRGKPGARLAGDPPFAGPARPAAHPAARHAARGGRPRAAN